MIKSSINSSKRKRQTKKINKEISSKNSKNLNLLSVF